MLLEKTTRMNFLFDFYQALLTEKQRSYMQLYYLDDHSLGEIAEVYDVSRQAVYDNIRRTETMLEEYEEKLQLFEKFQNRQQILAKLTESITDVQSATADQLALIEQLKQCD
ncbi:MAG TPA: putative DNA-binding protein [Rummeliibacillus sp.]|nr:putative DNA-binding protein [Rummeliibacillus sp.]